MLSASTVEAKSNVTYGYEVSLELSNTHKSGKDNLLYYLTNTILSISHPIDLNLNDLSLLARSPARYKKPYSITNSNKNPPKGNN